MKAKPITTALSLFSAGSRMTRGAACAACFVLALACAAHSLHHCLLIFQPKPAEKVIALRIQELRQDDPQAAQRLDALVGRHSPHALAASLEAAYKRKGLSGLRDVARGETSSIELASLALDPELNQTGQHREGFLTEHATVVEVLQRSLDDFQPDEYLRRIRRLSEDSQWWAPVRDDPLTLLVFTSPLPGGLHNGDFKQRAVQVMRLPYCGVFGLRLIWSTNRLLQASRKHACNVCS